MNKRIVIGIHECAKKDGTKAFRYYLGEMASVDGFVPLDTFYAKEMLIGVSVGDEVEISFGLYDGKYFIKSIERSTK